MPGTTLAIEDGGNNPKTLQVYSVGGNLLPTHTLGDPSTGNAANVQSGLSFAALSMAQIPIPNGVWLTFNNDAVAGTVVQIKATAGGLYYLDLINTTAATAYLQIFNLPAGSVTLGSTAPYFWVRLGSTSVSNYFKTLNLQMPFGGGTGLSVAGTTTATGNTGAAISVSALYV